ncbi:hypothetical protein GYMLUDRAFT_49636 [Collybiopsis luxurians FD-317 M1]|uniref:NmrA-like domain-containing protein n=1 Tax=Collybiopsis luxurians FD-317 M1 TaxID=944289 RepID=A0A0D0C589_9AGAR|nr:hypothetical protein GYMLUDRAFT_49636 [Collybiopsis luxurians FD-317 M1]
MSPKLILVTGATGRQGRAFIHALISATSDIDNAQNPGSIEHDTPPDFHILALTRNASSSAAKSLSMQYPDHLSIVQANLDSEPSIRKLFEEAKSKGGGGIWGVFCVLAFPGLGANADGEEAQGKTIANLALEYGVSTFIFSSVERGGQKDDDKPEILMQDRYAKVKIEQYIKQLGEKGLPWTILRPGFFMENYEGTIGSITVGVLKAGLQPTTTIQMVAIDDIGHVAAGVFRNPESFHHQILCIIGERSTMKAQEESYKRATGRSLPATPSIIARGLIAMNKHTKHLISDIERVHRIQEEPDGPRIEVDASIEATRRAYPHLRNFEDWASKGKLSSESRDPANSEGGGRKDGWNKVSVTKLTMGRQ